MVHEVCCGLDVHKKTITACLIITRPNGSVEIEIREFGTFTKDLQALRQWLIENDCPIVAMESTGIYWQPIFNVLEGYMEIILVNSRHFKNVPGRKTDVSDSQWLATLLRVGLLKASFVPPQQVRFWRDLVRTRRKYAQDLTKYKLKVQKLLESSNVKLTSVISDLFGKTGRQILKLLLEKEQITLEEIARCAKGKLKKKVQEIYCALQGFFEQHHRFMLRSFLNTIEHFEREIALLEKRIKEKMAFHQELLDRLKEVPGINEVVAQNILAELGPSLESFPNEKALAKWAGLCPGNNESAGKRYSGKNPVRKHPLKTILVEAAWGAIRVKDTFYAAKFKALSMRRGPKKAIVAIAHKILKAAFFIIKYKQRYRELGANYVRIRVRGMN